MTRKRIAFLGRGGHTLPTYRALLNKLAEHYEIVLYSEVPFHPDWNSYPHRYSVRSVPSVRVGRRIREFLFLILLILDHIRRPYVLVHAHSTYPTGFAAVIMQKIFRIPAIVSLHAGEGSALPDIKFGDLLYHNRKRVNQWVINQAKYVTALSLFQRNEVYSNLDIKRSIEVIPRGVEIEKFNFQRHRKLNSPVVFLSVGYLNPLKDPETLLRTFYLIQQKVNARLIHVGQDYTNGAVRQMVHNMGLGNSVRFEGYVDHDIIQKYYANADVFLHTSRYESAGMVVVEAMASGLLVCGTKVGLLSDLSGKCCITVPCQDEEALATVVLELLKDAERMETLTKNARIWIEENSLVRCAETIRNLYDLFIFRL